MVNSNVPTNKHKPTSSGPKITIDYASDRERPTHTKQRRSTDDRPLLRPWAVVKPDTKKEAQRYDTIAAPTKVPKDIIDKLDRAKEATLRQSEVDQLADYIGELSLMLDNARNSTSARKAAKFLKENTLASARKEVLGPGTVIELKQHVGDLLRGVSAACKQAKTGTGKGKRS